MSTRREPIALRRHVEATQIPSGMKMLLAEGAWVTPQQTLGGNVTVLTERGGLARIDAADADALGPEYEELARAAKAPVVTPDGPFDVERVWDQLRTVYDPEIPANIVDLGLVYLCEAEPLPDGGHKVHVRMTLTAPGCGIGPVLLDDVRRKVLAVPGVKEADVELVFEPFWEPSRMSEAARLALGFM